MTTRQEHKCALCGRTLRVEGLCPACSPKVRTALAEFKVEAERLAKDPKHNPAGFGPEAILGAMMRQSGWAHLFKYVLEGDGDGLQSNP